MLQFSGLSTDFNKSDNLLSGIPLKNKAFTMSANSLSTGLST
jgi:hypothetical protein